MATSCCICDNHEHQTLSRLHPDIIRANILSRLNATDLAAASCTSWDLHSLCDHPSLWRHLCTTTWPSVASLAGLISSEFKGGHRSFFWDALAGLDPVPATEFDAKARACGSLISAVDVFYDGSSIFSKVKEIETVSDWFACSPFIVDMVDRDTIMIPNGGDAEKVEERLSVRWVVVDSAQGRACSVSSGAVVRAERHWLSGELQLRFSTLMGGPVGDTLQCAVSVGVAKSRLTQLALHFEDVEGRHVCGTESVAVLANAIARAPRRPPSSFKDKERFCGFLEMRSSAREKRHARERALDLICVLISFSFFVSFWCFVLFRS